MGKKEMEENIVTLLGGRVAESLIMGDISTGASNDIERATKMARAMVTQYGFSEKLGPIVYGQDENEIFLGRDLGTTRNYSEEVAAEIDGEIRRIIGTAYKTAQETLSSHIGQLHLVAQYLIQNEKIGGDTFVKLMRGELLDEKANAATAAALAAQGLPADTSAQADSDVPDMPVAGDENA